MNANDIKNLKNHLHDNIRKCNNKVEISIEVYEALIKEAQKINDIDAVRYDADIDGDAKWERIEEILDDSGFPMDEYIDVESASEIGLITKAKSFATKAHEGQLRKSSGMAYISHPMRVAKILANAGFSATVIAAGFTHDTVEDTSITIEDIQREFGDAVAKLVAFNTEDKDKSWEERKQHTIDHLGNATLEEKALVVADKYANLLELVHQYDEKGEALWSAFKRGKEQQHWYFRSVGESGMKNVEPDKVPAFFVQYAQLVKDFFAA